VEDLKYEMVMALSAADFGGALCEQAAEICAEIADQHCRRLHVTRVDTAVKVIEVPASAPPRL
jgi:hypothetical protein